MYGDTFNLILGYIFLGIFTLLVLKKSYIMLIEQNFLQYSFIFSFKQFFLFQLFVPERPCA